MIASLNAFVAKDDGTDQEMFDKILEDFESSHERQSVLPAIFAVMERFPNADLGSPGVLVHSIETLPIPEYEPLLGRSVEQQPGQLNVWILVNVEFKRRGNDRARCDRRRRTQVNRR